MFGILGAFINIESTQEIQVRFYAVNVGIYELLKRDCEKIALTRKTLSKSTSFTDE